MGEFKIIFVISTFLFLANCFILHDVWETYKIIYQKAYATPLEEAFRFEVFRQNLQKIDELKLTDSNAEYGITKFTDMVQEEFEALYLGYNSESITYQLSLSDILPPPLINQLPDSWDWRDQGAVTPPKDQGICGACWAFSAVASIESQYFLKYRTLYNLSEQLLIDCDSADQGCIGGGSMIGAYSWLANNGGLETSQDYPYFGFDMPCAMNSSFEVAKISGYVNISQDEGSIAENLYTYGPLSTAINGGPLQFYKKGVLSPAICSKAKLNHAVTLIGFGTDQDKDKPVDFWIAKNSWGSGWDENGFFRIKRGEGICGINLNVSMPIIV